MQNNQFEVIRLLPLQDLPFFIVILCCSQTHNCCKGGLAWYPVNIPKLKLKFKMNDYVLKN